MAKNGHFRPFLAVLGVKIGEKKNETTSAIHSEILTLWLKRNFEILKKKNLIFGASDRQKCPFSAIFGARPKIFFHAKLILGQIIRIP